MPSLKDVQDQISAVGKTKQITKAMNMVATSRLRRCQVEMEMFRPYAEKFSAVLGSLAERVSDGANQLLTPREEVKNVHIVLCTSDRGLCGGFNVNLTNKAQKFINELTADEDKEIGFTAFGKRGRDWCRKTGSNITDEHIGLVGSNIPFNVASNLGRKLVDLYLNGTYDEVYIIYPNFINMGRQIPTIMQLLPIPPIAVVTEEVVEDQPYQPEHICEPSPGELLGDLLPRNVYVQLYSSLLETSTSEHAARMTAMDNATKACNDLVDTLTLAYNKARQSAITADLMDIVGGAEAING